MTVLERTRELGMLRALGSTRAMIARSVMAEALILGLLGSVLGVLFGYGGEGARLPFRQGVPVPDHRSHPLPFALLRDRRRRRGHSGRRSPLPGSRAGRVSPVEAMRARSGGRRRSRVLPVLAPLFGLLLLGAGAPWILPGENLSADLDGLVYASGIAAVIGAFLGVSLVIPALVRPLAALFSPVLRLLFGVEGRMAAANATRNRAGPLTASALMVGISLVVAFAALGGSVLGSIRTYLEGSLGSDYVVQPASQNSDVTFSKALPEKISRYLGVETQRASPLPICATARM